MEIISAVGIIIDGTVIVCVVISKSIVWACELKAKEDASVNVN